ncbi:bifunctional 2',3'-cyclic-nucleotide 2'-phosphodiesterase/3'-nucleotidase [Aerosticca soli]|uniref:2',3'-cyclic-nucleotide 2'-phosphodiesterase n=1 Tax=Aerosticca soli TaxID=2010829 RepID=A0A2Z6E243_9GAMM|nr:bifunctional 2',3'-cyclic-nucleotide 2'-phosphodiesterase/3'-nucleotidase [Aerosticca soli]BBD79012.1 2',3'-cyclic-nucleotide 2'-phosphodiesterase [Aerosticca soli]
MRRHLFFMLVWVAALLAGCGGQRFRPGTLPEGARADVAILETTDLHANVLSYDYLRARPDPTLGFERTATLIGRARATFPNSLLFDVGDTVQGTLLADYQAKAKPLGCAEELAIYQAMDALGYDGGTLGNHDFNYGLPFLSQVTATPMTGAGVPPRHCAGPHFPLVLANVVGVGDGHTLYPPWTVLTRTIEAYTLDGSRLQVPLKVGIIGFTPPPIMQWDRPLLAGRVTVRGAVEAARAALPALEAQHPDLIVALLHGGLDASPYASDMENPGWHLAAVPGIDVLLLGHAHATFPGPRYAGMPGVDAERGFVRGVPAVMGGFFGKDLGLVKLALVRQHGRWVLDRGATSSQVQPICPTPATCVPPDPAIAPRIAAVQKAVLAHVDTPLGTSTLPLTSYFADVGEQSALAVVNAAQADYVRRQLPRERPDLAGWPVLSAAAAFRTGFAGADDYTDVPAGTITVRHTADLYYYPNALAAVSVDGAGLKAWLEHAAQRFARIDPDAAQPQALIDTHFAGFNFDQIQGEGLEYRIDPSRPPGRRIVDLRYQGRPVTAGQHFVVATNAYRANGGGHFPGLDGRQTVLADGPGVRDVVADWIARHSPITAASLPPRSWRFAPLDTRAAVTFVSAGGKAQLARQAGLEVRELEDHGDGSATYAIDLSH